jgi:hypothetical protein
MSWKKVISSGSDATLGALTLASGLKIPLLATDASTSGGLTTHDILVIDTGSVKVIDQQDLVGLNTTYAVNSSPPGLTLTADGDNNYEIAIDDTALLHDSLGNITASQHIKWSQTQAGNSPDVIHANNYLNNTYLTTTGLGQAATGNGIEQEISSSETQSWTHVGPLGSVSPGGSIGSINTEGNATFVPFSITTTGSITSDALLYSGGDLTASTATIGNNLTVNYPYGISASNISSPGNWVVDNYLGIQGTFFMDTLGFQENIIQTHTGSHNWGGPAADTVTTWNGNITVVPPAAVSSSGGFYGDGSQLTGLVASGFTFAGLDTASSPYGVYGTTEFDFTADATYSINLDSTTDGTPSGFTASAAGLRVKDLGVTTTFLSASAVQSLQLENGNVVSASLSQSLISDLPDLTEALSVLALNNAARLLVDQNGVTFKLHPYWLAHGVDVAYTGSNNNLLGSVTSVGVTPGIGATINGLYLTITEDVNTTPQISLAGSITNLTNANWDTSGNDLAVTRGGTGADNLQDAAANIFSVSQGGSLSLGTGAVGEHITISGSLQTNSTSSAVKSDNFASEDQFITIAQGDTGNTDAGIKFGSALTSSNTIVFDGSSAGTDRFSLSETTTDVTGVSGLKHSLIGVSSGSANVSGHSKPGNIKVDAGEIYLYVA